MAEGRATGPVSLGAPPLIGRGPELAAIGAVLDAPEGRGVLVTGAIGVGKSRLAGEVMSRRAATGTVVLRAIATEATADIPLGALAAIAGPGVRAGDRREAIVEGVVAHLVEGAGGSELLIVVDDVNLLDPQSHSVVRALVERRVARVVGTARTPGPVLPAPWTTPGVVHITLGDLDVDAVAEVLVSMVGGPVAGDTTRQLASATQGNPLLLNEAIAAAGRDGSLRCVDGIWALADGVHPVGHLGDLVRARLAPLADEARDAVELVAVAEVLPVTLASAVIDPSVLAELESAGLVRREAALGRVVLRPAHPIYGEALRAGLGPIARRHHARRLADASERAPNVAVDALRVVAWRVTSGAKVAPDLLARAAREARRRSEFDQAEDLAARAVEAGGGTASLLLLGEIQNAVGRCEEADATFRRVVDPIFVDGGFVGGDEEQASLVGLCALAGGFNRAWGLGRGREARDMMLETSRALGRSASAATVVVGERRDELAADAAALAAFTGDPRRAVAEAEALLTSDLSPRSTARAAFAAAAGLIGLGRPEAAIGQSDRGLAAIAEMPEGFGRAFGTNLVLTRIMGLADSGRLAEAEAEAHRAYRGSVTAAFLTGQAVSAWALGRVIDLGGRAVTAERWLREARLLERDLQTRGRRRWSLVALGLALSVQGRWPEVGEVVSTLDRIDGDEPADDRFVAADDARLRAGLRAAQGELSAAEALLSAAAEDASATGATGAAVVLWHEMVLTASTRAQALDAAVCLDAVGDGIDGTLHRARVADASAVLARDPRTRLAIAQELEGCGAARCALALVTAVTADASSLGERGVVRTAREMATRIGHRCEGVGHSAVDPTSLLARLGPRQREVVLLAAQGLSNHDVAERLGLAVRTVENHLHRAYVELGVDGRRDLAALTASSGSAADQSVQRRPSTGGVASTR